MEIEYRVMTAKDFDGVQKLWQNVPEISTNSTDDGREGIEKYLKRNPTTSFIAVSDGMIVGAILAGHDGRRGFIQHLAVLCDYRKKGIAAQLTRNAIEALEAESIIKTALLAFRKNDNANAFWEKMGFTVRNDVYYRNRSIGELEYRDNPFRDE